jgi:orotate phosphoribosyltransferase
MASAKNFTNEEVLDVFKSCGGLLEGHFLLTSGRHSDRYMQCAKLFVEPEKAEKLCAALALKLKDFKIDVVAAPAVGGIIIGYIMARLLGARNVFAEREDGKMTFRRGFEISPKDRVLVVEDVVTTGGSAAEVVELVKKCGADAAAVASIVDRSNGKVDFGVPYRALLSMEVISYEAAECPLCRKGLPLIKPGRRKLPV